MGRFTGKVAVVTGASSGMGNYTTFFLLQKEKKQENRNGYFSAFRRLAAAGRLPVPEKSVLQTESGQKIFDIDFMSLF